MGLALTLTIQVKKSIKRGLGQLRHSAIPTQNIETELENELELITQESQPTSENITDMDLEKESHKRKERPIPKGISTEHQ